MFARAGNSIGTVATLAVLLCLNLFHAVAHNGSCPESLLFVMKSSQTVAGGVVRHKQEHFAYWSSEDGLLGDSVAQILDDGLGNLCLGCDRGISKLGKQDRESHAAGKIGRLVLGESFNEASGLLSAECASGSSPAGLRTRAGRLSFPTLSGLMVIDPAKLGVRPSRPRVIIEHLKLWGKPFPSSARPTEQVGDEIAPVSLPAQPGMIQVLPIIGETLWFKLSVAAMLLIIAAIAVRRWYKSRMQVAHRLHEVEKAVQQERMRIARDFHDELGSLLTEISLLTQAACQHKNGNQSCAIPRISKACEEAVLASDTIVWDLGGENDTLPRLVNYLVQYAEQFFRSSIARVRFDVPTELPEISFPPQDRRNLVLAVKEALTNVARHSATAEVWLRVRLEGDDLHVVIDDNGCGFERRVQDAGRDGLLNVQRRLSAMGGSAEVDSVISKGTSVKLVLPIPRPPVVP